MEKILFRRAAEADVEPLRQLAVQSYLDHYSDIWTPENLDRYLDYAYSETVFREFLTDLDTLVWVAAHGERLVGYLVLKTKLPLAPGMPGGCQVKRLYFLAGSTGNGLGRALLDIAIAEARRLGRSYIWLDVMKCSPAAVAFYERAGFVIHSDKSFSLIPFRTPELSELWNMVLDLTGGQAGGIAHG